MTGTPPPNGEGGLPAGSVLPLAGCLYFVLLALAVAWLAQRDRLAALQTEAIGRHGPWLAAGAGLSAGLLLTAGVAGAARRWQRLSATLVRVRDLVGPLRERQITALALLSAISEEVFFRLAVQDAFGLPISVAAYVVLNTGPGFWAWTPIAAVTGLAFGLLVQQGFGLLAATVAHATFNELTFRRIMFA